MCQQSTTTDVVRVQKGPELLGLDVLANNAEQLRRHTERGEVAGDIGSAAGHAILTFEIHDWHRCFRGDARDAAPDEMIEHDVAYYQDAGAFCAGEDLPRLDEADRDLLSWAAYARHHSEALQASILSEDRRV